MSLDRQKMPINAALDSIQKTKQGFDALMQQTDPSVTTGYDIAVTENEIWITERVHNLLFCKESNKSL